MSKAIKLALEKLSVAREAEVTALEREFEERKRQVVAPFAEAEAALRKQCKHDGDYITHENHHNGDYSFECEYCGKCQRIWPPVDL